MLKLKPPSDKEIFDKLVSAVKFSIYTDGYNWSFWKTGGGWGEVLRRYKPYTPKDKKDDKEGKGGKGKKGEEEEKPVKGKGKAPLKGEPKPKGRGNSCVYFDNFFIYVEDKARIASSSLVSLF